MGKIINNNKLNVLTILWQQFIKGDEKAFTMLYEQTIERLFQYGIKFTNNQEMVKDCIQELYFKLYQNKKDLPIMENPIYYLLKSLKNILIDSIRKESRIIYCLPEELHFNVEFTYQPIDQEDADEKTKAQFEKIISLLSERQKEAIYLRYQAGLSYEEISTILGMNNQSARNLVHRSIEKVKSEMHINMFIALLSNIL